jgi:hypothetical protein
MPGRRRERARLELLETVEGFIKDLVHELDGGAYLERLVDEIQKGKTNPHRAAQEITERIASKFSKVKNRGKHGL